MLVTRGQVAGMDALIDVVARYGEVSAIEKEHVVITLAATAYKFFVHSNHTSSCQEPYVLLASIAATPGAVAETVVYAQSKLLFTVDQRAASRVTAAFDRFGQCVWCAGYAHTGCAGRSGEPCQCACRAEWEAISAATMAMQIMMRAPLPDQPAAWGSPCLCACQLRQDCGACGHAGCAATRAQS